MSFSAAVSLSFTALLPIPTLWLESEGVATHWLAHPSVTLISFAISLLLALQYIWLATCAAPPLLLSELCCAETKRGQNAYTYTAWIIKKNILGFIIKYRAALILGLLYLPGV